MKEKYWNNNRNLNFKRIFVWLSDRRGVNEDLEKMSIKVAVSVRNINMNNLQRGSELGQKGNKRNIKEIIYKMPWKRITLEKAVVEKIIS